jgi:hypothetical protein
MTSEDNRAFRREDYQSDPSGVTGEFSAEYTSPPNVSPLLEREYKQLEKDHLTKVKFSQSEEKYLTQYLLYMDKKKRVRREDRCAVVDTVGDCMGEIKQRLQEYPEFANGELIECGSFFEDTKVGDPHEFDFIYLMPLENYTAKVAQMTKMKAKRSNLESKTFFRLYHAGDGEEYEIVAKEKHDTFRTTLEGILMEMFGLNEGIMTKKAGPAVKFVLVIPNTGKTRKQDKNWHVKVDLTMAFSSSPKHPFFDQVELRSYAEFLRSQDQLQCHFIPAHDFWKLSFTTTEKELMARVGAVNYKGVCYRAIKVGITHGQL